MPLSLRSTRRPLQVDLSKLEVRPLPFPYIDVYCTYALLDGCLSVLVILILCMMLLNCVSSFSGEDRHPR